jgi:hypothetical protein
LSQSLLPIARSRPRTMMAILSPSTSASSMLCVVNIQNNLHATAHYVAFTLLQQLHTGSYLIA